MNKIQFNELNKNAIEYTSHTLGLDNNYKDGIQGIK